MVCSGRKSLRHYWRLVFGAKSEVRGDCALVFAFDPVTADEEWTTAQKVDSVGTIDWLADKREGAGRDRRLSIVRQRAGMARLLVRHTVEVSLTTPAAPTCTTPATAPSTTSIVLRRSRLWLPVWYATRLSCKARRVLWCWRRQLRNRNWKRWGSAHNSWTHTGWIRTAPHTAFPCGTTSSRSTPWRSWTVRIAFK